MERTGIVSDLSQVKAQVAKFRHQPRPGQLRAFEHLLDCPRKACIKLPTGYGKTYTALGTYSILKDAGVVNRMLIIFPTDSQLQQFEKATPARLREYAIDGPPSVSDIRFFGAKAIEKHIGDKCQIYAITVQSLIGARGMDNVNALLGKGRWLVVVDEYHHYGIDKPFGGAVNSLSYEFLLCMSATPYRPSNDSAFGAPSIEVKYREAVAEKAVKPLRGYAYHYRIDAIDESGDVVSYTTEELIAAAGGDSPEKVQKLTRKMRFSPKYISPLITNPIDRMLRDSLDGKIRQAIIGCMSVSHAKLVCEQVGTTFPGIAVDWVGTGDDGRSTTENQAIINRFAPADGSEPSLDVIVHVGMAGEGLDTVHVSEVIHLNAAGVNNSNNQENGRASRYVPGVTGHVNFDGCSGYARDGYVGAAVMDAMDNDPPSQDPEDSGEEPEPADPDSDWLDLPDNPEIRIYDLECTKIDSGDHTVQMMVDFAIKDPRTPFSAEDFADPNGEPMAYLINGVKEMRKREAELMDEKSVIQQWKDSVDRAVSVLTGNIIKIQTAKGVRVEKSMRGDIKKRINTRKKRDLGAIDNDKDLLKLHYDWVKRLETEIKTAKGVPSWLA